MARNPPWNREETLMAFALYLLLPSGQQASTNADVRALAQSIGRTPGAVSFKLGNLKSCDPMRTGVGLTNASKMDRAIWEEYRQKGDALTEEAMALLLAGDVPPAITIDYLGHELPEGRERVVITAVRANQDYFRNALMENYAGRCCLTGISHPQLLVASHIKPWSASNAATERLTPENGLLLNALHDRAFDQGLITIDQALKIRVSPKVPKSGPEAGLLWTYAGRSIDVPGPHKPRLDFIEYHNDVIFQR